MNNTNEILERILLNMKYDSKKTLSENKKILIEGDSEKCKKLKSSFLQKATPQKKGKERVKGDSKYGNWGDGTCFCCEAQGMEDGTFNKKCCATWTGATAEEVTSTLVNDRLENLKNNINTINEQTINTVDYNGSSMSFIGTIHQTIGQFVKKLEDEINSNEYAYRKKQIYSKVPVKMPGFLSSMKNGSQLWKDYNNNRLDRNSDLYSRIQYDVRNQYRPSEPTGGWEYKKTYLGYFAGHCRTALQVKMVPNEKEREELKYSNNAGYLEPVDVPECVKNSIATIKNKFKNSAPFSFFAYDTKKNEYDFYDFRFNCGGKFKATASIYQDFGPGQQYDVLGRQIDKDGKVTVYTQESCATSIITRGYYNKKGENYNTIKKQQQEEVKKYKKYVTDLEKEKSDLEARDLEAHEKLRQDSNIKQLPSLSSVSQETTSTSGGVRLQLSGGN